jgi:Tfp pilus assembly protein PilV
MCRGNSPGFSLIGVLFAVIFIAAGSLLMAQLVSRTEHVAGGSEHRFVATQLAGEGIELIRARRDSNWLAGPPTEWTDGICAGDSVYALAVDTDRIEEAANSTEGNVVFTTQAGFFTHAVSNNLPTLYKRLVTVDCTVQEERIALTSRVQWEERGQTQVIELKDTLYDWYRDE